MLPWRTWNQWIWRQIYRVEGSWSWDWDWAWWAISSADPMQNAMTSLDRLIEIGLSKWWLLSVIEGKSSWLASTSASLSMSGGGAAAAAAAVILIVAATGILLRWWHGTTLRSAVLPFVTRNSLYSTFSYPVFLTQSLLSVQEIQSVFHTTFLDIVAHLPSPKSQVPFKVAREKMLRCNIHHILWSFLSCIENLVRNNILYTSIHEYKSKQFSVYDNKSN